MRGHKLNQFDADARADFDLMEIGGDAGGRELCRLSPLQSWPGQRAVGVEDRHAERRVAGAPRMLLQKLGDLGVLSSKPSNGLPPETGVLVNGAERDAIDQT